MQIGSFGITNFLPNADAVPAWQVVYTADELPENAGFPFYPGGDIGCTEREILTGGFYRYKSTLPDFCLQQAAVWNADANTGFTVEARIKAISSGDLLSRFTGIAVAAGTANTKAILLVGTAGVWEYGTSFFGATPFLMDTTDSFHDYRITVQGTAFTIYVDGIARLTGSATIFIENNLWWGDGTGNAGAEALWDCVSFTTEGAFSPAQLASPSCGTPNCTEPPSGMVSWWDGDAVIGTTAKDIKDGNDGMLVNGATTAPGKVGQAFSLDGMNDYVDFPENMGLNLDFATVDMWLFPTMSSADLTGRHFIDKRTPVFGGEYTSYVRGNGDIDVGFDTSGSDPIFDGAAGLIPMNAWTHIAFTWDGSNLFVYRNGLLIGTASGSGTIVKNAESVKIGTRSDLDGIHSFIGRVDEAEIYDRALTQEEIQAIFNAGNAGKCKVPADTNPPVIALLGDNPATVECGSPYVDAGATAFDEEDGDLTGLIVTSGLPIDTTTVGSHTITYDGGVVDAAGNAAEPVGRTVNVVDTTAPSVAAALVPVNNEDDDNNDDDEDEGLFMVDISASDICDPNPALTANINGIPVVDGQIVKLELDDDTEVKKKKKGPLEIEAPSFTLTATATDASGNTATATATPVFGGEEEEDEDNNEDNDNDNDNDDNDNSDNDD